MSDEPELRSGPPWAMEEMIRAQAGLPGEIAAAARRSGWERGSLGAESVLFTGCGTSEHAARAARAITREAFPDARLHVRDAFETRLPLPTAGSWSRSPTRPARRRRSPRRRPPPRLSSVTAHPERVPAGIDAVATPLHDRSWCHTVAYVSPLLVHALFAGLTAERATALIGAALEAGSPDAGRLAGLPPPAGRRLGRRRDHRLRAGAQARGGDVRPHHPARRREGPPRAPPGRRRAHRPRPPALRPRPRRGARPAQREIRGGGRRPRHAAVG